MLLQFICAFEAPLILHTDNGGEFVNEVVKHIKLVFPNIKLANGRPYRPPMCRCTLAAAPTLHMCMAACGAVCLVAPTPKFLLHCASPTPGVYLCSPSAVCLASLFATLRPFLLASYHQLTTTCAMVLTAVLQIATGWSGGWQPGRQERDAVPGACGLYFQASCQGFLLQEESRYALLV